MATSCSRRAIILLAGWLVTSVGSTIAADGPLDVRDVCVRVAAPGGLTDGQIADFLAAGEATALGPGGPCVDEGRIIVEPREDLIDVRPIGWDRLVAHPDGRTFTVTWVAGVPECSGLDRVEIERVPDGLKVSVWVGDVPGVAFCDLALRQYETTVELDAPAILGGDSGAE